MKQGKTLLFSLKIRPNHPSLEKHHEFIPIFNKGHMLPNQWNREALFLSYVAQAAENGTPHLCPPGWEMHRLGWEEMFLWHLILLACCTWNEQQQKEWDISLWFTKQTGKKKTHKPTPQRRLWLIWYSEKRKSHKHLCFHDKVYI